MNEDNSAPSPINPGLTGAPVVAPSSPVGATAPFPTTLPTVFGDDEESTETKTVDLGGGAGEGSAEVTVSADLPAPKLDDSPPLEIPEVSPSGSGVPDVAGEAEVKAEEKSLPSLDDLDAMMQTGEAAKEEAAVAEGGADLPLPSAGGGGESQSSDVAAGANEGTSDVAAPSLPGSLQNLDELNAELPAAPIEPVETLPNTTEGAEEKLPEINEALPDLDSLSLKPTEAEGSSESTLPTGEVPTELPVMSAESAAPSTEVQPVETATPDLGSLPESPALPTATPAPEESTPDTLPAFDLPAQPEATDDNLPSLTDAMQEVETAAPMEMPTAPAAVPPAFDLSNLSIDSLGQEATTPEEMPVTSPLSSPPVSGAETAEAPQADEMVIPLPAEPPSLTASQPLSPEPIVTSSPTATGLDFDLDNVANLDPKLIIDQQLSKLDQELAELQQKVGKMRQASENLRKEIEQKQYSAQVIDYALNSSMSRITECEQQKQDLLAAKAQIA